MRQGPAVLHHVKHQRIDRLFSQRRRVGQETDDLASQHPQVACVFANGLVREVTVPEVAQERPEALDDGLAGRHICRESHPAVRPLVEVLATREAIDRADGTRSGRRLRYGTTFRAPPEDHRHGSDDDSKSVLSLPGLRL